MNGKPVVVEGIVEPDGTLKVEGKISLPAGKVRVTVASLLLNPEDHPFFQMLREIWAAREKAGLQPRSVEEVEAERKQFRDGIEEEIAEAGQFQDESRRLREEAKRASKEAQ